MDEAKESLATDDLSCPKFGIPEVVEHIFEHLLEHVDVVYHLVPGGAQSVNPSYQAVRYLDRPDKGG